MHSILKSNLSQNGWDVFWLNQTETFEQRFWTSGQGTVLTLFCHSYQSIGSFSPVHGVSEMTYLVGLEFFTVTEKKTISWLKMIFIGKSFVLTKLGSLKYKLQGICGRCIFSCFCIVLDSEWKSPKDFSSR